MIRNNIWHYIILFLYLIFIVFCFSLKYTPKIKQQNKKDKLDKLDLIIKEVEEIKFILQNNH